MADFGSVNILGSIYEGQRLRDYADQRKATNELRNLYRGADIASPTGRETLAQSAFKIDPERGLALMDQFGKMDDRSKQRALALKQDAARIALQIKDAPPESKAALWAQAQGMYPEVYDNPYQPGAEDTIISEAQTFDQLLEQRQKAAERTYEESKPQTSLAKLRADLKAGRISVADYAAALRKETYIEGPQPQRLPLDTTVYDPNAAGDKGAYVYATGPLKGQIARPGSAAAQPSSVTEAYDRGLAYAKAHKFPDPEGWALAYSKSGSPDYRLPETGINPLPKDSSGAIDKGALEQGLYYDTPQGPAKYLGDDKWELAE